MKTREFLNYSRPISQRRLKRRRQKHLWMHLWMHSQMPNSSSCCEKDVSAHWNQGLQQKSRQSRTKQKKSSWQLATTLCISHSAAFHGPKQQAVAERAKKPSGLPLSISTPSSLKAAREAPTPFDSTQMATRHRTSAFTKN